jgi:endonuclease/exonuclease/phosphatase family metal-dependent hydrolase
LLAVRLRVLSWNLMHGRSLPAARRDLFDEFAGAIARWDWDVALLQEVPPWWPALLTRQLPAQSRSVLTSRNSWPALRRAIAVRWPDAIKSSGGGANAILVRAPEAIAEHRWRRLRLAPERRMLHAVRLASGCWVGNLHATVHRDRAARVEAAVAARAMLRWAAAGPVVLGGDFNARGLALQGLELIGSSAVDYVFAAGLRAGGSCDVLARGRLSDHAPIAVTLERGNP